MIGVPALKLHEKSWKSQQDCCRLAEDAMSETQKNLARTTTPVPPSASGRVSRRGWLMNKCRRGIRGTWNSVRGETGQLIIDQLLSIMLLVPIFTLLLGLIDASLLYAGSTVNEGLSREATRMAAAGPVADYEGRINTYLNKRKEEFGAGLMRNVQVVPEKTGVDIASARKLGTISVTTSMDIYPLFVLGGILTATNKVPYMRVTSQHTYPLSNPGSSSP